MRTNSAKLSGILAGAMMGALLGAATAAGQPSQSFVSPGSTMDPYAAAMLGDGALSDAPDASLYAQGTKAIRDGKWKDAEEIFEKIAAQKGPHAAGALYWKAYALNKMGEAEKSVDTCAALREQFVGSTWIDDCGALEIEIASSKGQVVQPHPGESDELKLLALVTLMQKDPTRARAQIDEIVQGDSSEKLKEGALFVLGQNVPDVIYPEIVRISYLEGDVRIARAASNQKGKDVTWENAVMNLPLEEGDSLVTGKDGRVEIELEDASTIYMAENSVLNCENMRSTSSVPHTELALVSGTVTLHLDSLVPGETFTLHTPKNELLTHYPYKSDMRVTSYVDGIAITSLSAGAVNVGETTPELCTVASASAICPHPAKEDVVAGKAYTLGEDHQLVPMDPAKAGDYAAFDLWVADRYAARTSAVAEVMQESGLQRPIPGMAALKGKGAFYDCQPYGKCWQPTPQKSPLALNGNGGGASPAMAADWNDWFPCMPGPLMGNYGFGYGYGYGMNPTLMQMGYMQGYGMMPGMLDPMAWALCHAGYWIPWDNGYGNRGYAWVANHKLHHKIPVRWVKSGRTVAFVPLHPRDVKGQPPLNRAHAFEPVKGKDGYKLNRVSLTSTSPVQLMKEPPRAFRNTPQPVLARVQAPHMEAHALKGTPGAIGTRTGLALAHGTAMPLTFNREHGFMTSQSVVQGSRTVTVNMPVGHPVGGSGSAFGGGGFAGGGHAGFGAGFGGGASHGGSFSGGGGGGGSAGGGHFGGGGGTATSSSVSASGASSAAASAPAPASGSHK